MKKCKELEEENEKLKFDIEARKELKKAREEKISFLEECLDRKEELNDGYRKELKLSTIAEETISDLQARIKELSEENGQLRENEKYRHSRCMKAERQVQHSLD